MSDTIEAIVDQDGNLRPLTRIDLPEGQHVRIRLETDEALAYSKEWAAEVRRRHKEVKDGKVKLLPVRDVIAEVKRLVQ